MTREVLATPAPAPGMLRQVRRAARRDRLARHSLTWLRVAVLVLGAFVLSVPLLWMISTSLKDWSEVFRYPPDIIPRKIVWHNYVEAFTIKHSWGTEDMPVPGGLPPLVLFTRNTLVVAAAVVVGAVLSNSLIAFGFARLRFVGRNVAFFAMLATMMLPGQVTMIPIFVMFRNLGWLDTYLPLTVPAFFGNAWLAFLFRQYIMTIPIELDDAARIDGCSTFGIFWKVILPLSRPIITTIALFSFAGVWNDYFGPLIYLTSFEKWTISMGLANLPSMLGPTQQVTPYHLMMAAALSVSLPMILIFYFLQGTFVRSIVLTGLKA
jgi:ABC-type glycerol-3-phosphate transport system permease component